MLTVYEEVGKAQTARNPVSARGVPRHPFPTLPGGMEPLLGNVCHPRLHPLTRGCFLPQNGTSEATMGGNTVYAVICTKMQVGSVLCWTGGTGAALWSWLCSPCAGCIYSSCQDDPFCPNFVFLCAS